MTEQEKFEAWYAKTFNSQAAWMEDESRYMLTYQHDMWVGWQAAIASHEPKMRKATRDEKIVNPGVYEVPASREPMPIEKAEEFAHRIASKYTHKSDRKFTAYTFLPHTLEDFVRKVERFHGIGE